MPTSPRPEDVLDDRSTAMFEQFGILGPHPVPDAREVDFDHLAPVLQGELGGLRAGEVDAGVVVREVQPGQSARPSRPPSPRRSPGLRHVRGDIGGNGVSSSQLDRLPSARLVDVRDDDLRTCGNHGEGGRPPNPRGRARHNADAPGERVSGKGECIPAPHRSLQYLCVLRALFPTVRPGRSHRGQHGTTRNTSS